MAGTKISALAELTALDPQTDWLPIVDTSDTTMAASGTDKKLKPLNLSVKGADIASAGTTNLATATGDFVDVTGVTTITAFGTAGAGVQRWVRFTGILILTHNATSLILPTGANITTAAGDIAGFRSLGSGNWVCAAYQRASGASLTGGVGAAAFDALTVKGADVASSTTPDLTTSTTYGVFIHITGTTTITGFASETAGIIRILRFAGALTLTHNATSLILPFGASITTAANDVAVMVSEGSGNWRCVGYSRASAATAFDALTVKGSDIASATTTNLATATGSYVEVTGTVTITGFGTAAAGVQRWLRFMGALTITHNATSMILPGGVNLVTEAGDRAQFVSLGSGNWFCLNFLRMSGREIINAPADPVPIRCLRSMTAAAYAALGGGTDPNTIYFIVG